MAENNAFLNVEVAMQILECPICCELIHNAFETSCGHAFCEFCLNKCLERENVCPVCRKDPSPAHPRFIIRRITEEFRKAHGLRREQVATKTSADEKQTGNAFYNQGKYAEAIKHYTFALEIEASAVLFANRSVCYFKLRQYRLAIEDADRALSMNPTFVKVFVRKALCLEQLRYFNEALEYFKKAQPLDKTMVFKDEIDGGIRRLSKIASYEPSQGSPSNQSNAPRPNQSGPWGASNIFSDIFGSGENFFS